MKKIKQSMMVLLCAVMLLILLPNTAEAATMESGTCGENLTWSINEYYTLTISGTGLMDNYTAGQSKPWQKYKPYLKKVVIKSGVTSIGDYAFSNHQYLESITIPSSVKTIGTRALYNADLKSLSIPNSVTAIGAWAFASNNEMTTLTLSSKLQVIEEYTFSSCGVKSVTIPSSVTAIGEGAFDDSPQLTSVTIPNSVTSIGKYAFAEDKALKTVSIGSGVTTIEEGAFDGCYALTKFTVNSKNSSFSSDSRGALYNKDKTVLYRVPGQMSGSYAPSDAVTTINPHAFIDCVALTQVQLGKNVSQIGRMAFYGCTGVTAYRVDSENPYCFADNRGVLYCNGELVVAPKNISGEYRIPNGVTAIADYAFYECTQLVSIIIGRDVSYVGEESFSCCRAMTTMSIPKNICFEYDNFYDCRSMKDVYYRGTQTEWDALDPYKSPTASLIPYLRVMSAPPSGDVDDDWLLSTDDAVYLLLAVLFDTEDYPVPDGMDLDFDGSGEVDTDDAVYLLLHIMFGAEDYPLSK